MRILVACEMSGRVRDAFIRRGHDAISCDLLPSLAPGPHYCGDVRDLLLMSWGLVIAFPPCTHLSASGARWFAEKRADGRQQEGVDFFRLFTALECKWAIENPKGIMSRLYRKPDQIIQPWQFGHGETKETHLWLHGLPKLVPTDIVDGREARIHRMPPGPDRGVLRSLTYHGIADAMADQWGWGLDEVEAARVRLEGGES
jgi:hypothetical protein